VVNVADLWKFTSLHEASAKGKFEICRLLLKVLIIIIIIIILLFFLLQVKHTQKRKKLHRINKVIIRKKTNKQIANLHTYMHIKN